jgi:hypothetical protein
VRTFIVRLHEHPGGSTRAVHDGPGRGDRSGAAGPWLRGVVDDVATGLRVTFRNDRELVLALMAAVGAGPPGPPRDTDGHAPPEP